MEQIKLSPKKQEVLKRHRHRYEAAMAELADLGFVLQGSIAERWMKCGKTECACHRDPSARHGPYYQWSWKRAGRTESMYLTPEQAELCRGWVANHRRAEKILKRMREISLKAARVYEIKVK